MSDFDRVIAVVEYVRNANRGYNAEFVRLRPWLRWQGEWIAIENREEEFPEEGLVYWPRPRGLRIDAGQAWIVELEPHAGREDAFRIRAGFRPTRPWEVVTVPSVTDAPTLRRVLAARPFALSPEPMGLALLAHPSRSDVWLAPFDAQPNADGLFDHTFTGGFSKVLEIADLRAFDATVAGVHRRLVDPLGMQSTPIGQFAVQPDTDLVSGLGRRLRKWDRNALEALGMTQAAFDAFAKQLGEATVDEGKGQDEARREAIAALLNEASIGRDNANHLVASIAEHPAVRAILEDRFQEEIVARRAELELELAEMRRLETDRVKQLVSEREDAERTLAGLEGALASRIEEVVGGGLPMLADNLVTRVLVTGRSVGRVDVKAATDEEQHAPSQPIATVHDLHNAVSRSAIHNHLDPKTAILVAGLALARNLILLAGASAASLATSVGATLGGQRTYRVAVGPTMFSLPDLLAAPVASVGGATTPRTLGMCLKRALEADESVVIVLQGCNRAPPEGALADLLEAVTRARSDEPFAWTDTQGASQSAPVGPRTVVIGTLVDGATTFRLPASLATRMPIVDADRAMTDSSLMLASGPLASTSIVATLWDTLDIGAPEGTAEEVGAWRDLDRTLDSEWILRRYLNRASHALAGLEVRFESFAALVLGRPSYEVGPLAKRLKETAPRALDLDVGHRRLAKFVERESTR